MSTKRYSSTAGGTIFSDISSKSLTYRQLHINRANEVRKWSFSCLSRSLWFLPSPLVWHATPSPTPEPRPSVSFGSGVADDIRLKEAIRSTVERHCTLAQRATWLLKLYCLECREEEPLCRLDKDSLVLHCLNVATGQASVRKPEYRDMAYLLYLYDRDIKPLLHENRWVVPRHDLPNPLQFTATRILTAYKNQIQCNFLQFLHKLRRKDPDEGEDAVESPDLPADELRTSKLYWQKLPPSFGRT